MKAVLQSSQGAGSEDLGARAHPANDRLCNWVERWQENGLSPLPCPLFSPIERRKLLLYPLNLGWPGTLLWAKEWGQIVMFCQLQPIAQEALILFLKESYLAAT